MTTLSRDAWNQLKNKTIQDIQRALERDGWGTAEHWVRMQGSYDLARERQRQAAA